jgi:hypothetical protein
MQMCGALTSLFEEGLSELLVYCADCWEREFGGD